MTSKYRQNSSKMIIKFTFHFNISYCSAWQKLKVKKLKSFRKNFRIYLL